MGITLGLISCTVAFVTYVNIHTSLQQRPAASQGRIISCHMESVAFSIGDTMTWADDCRPAVQFQTASGQEIAFVSSYTWGGFHQGDNVSVRYQPDRPQETLIVSDGLWVNVEIDSFLGLLFLLVSLFWISSLRHKRSRGES
ncbi:MAG: DUF3592 domain-containing protein [Ktedonobacteraceae bacterium]|nr:DUF3592 domain-containing protein [Ktedonobacteraceae bacterium]